MITDLHKIIGANIRKHRVLHGWTQTQLGKRAKLAQEEISRLENAQKDCFLSSIESIANAYGIEVTALFKK